MRVGMLKLVGDSILSSQPMMILKLQCIPKYAFLLIEMGKQSRQDFYNVGYYLFIYIEPPASFWFGLSSCLLHTWCFSFSWCEGRWRQDSIKMTEVHNETEVWQGSCGLRERVKSAWQETEEEDAVLPPEVRLLEKTYLIHCTV